MHGKYVSQHFRISTDALSGFLLLQKGMDTRGKYIMPTHVHKPSLRIHTSAAIEVRKACRIGQDRPHWAAAPLQPVRKRQQCTNSGFKLLALAAYHLSPAGKPVLG